MAESVAILGGGAIGQLLAAMLVESGHRVTLIDRPGSPCGVREHQLTDTDGGRRRHRLAHCGPDQFDGSDLLLVTTKAYQAEDALPPLLTHLDEATPIVLLHNGMGPQQRLAKRLPERHWWAGTLTDGALRESASEVRHTGMGQRFAGPLSRRAPLPAPLAEIGFQLDDNIQLRLWQKLAVNALINPLTALNRCRNGDLIQPRYRARLTQLSTELAEVAANRGVPLTAEQVLSLGLTVAEATAANRSSMLSDIEAGRDTEIEAISGYLVTQAEAAGIEVPAHRDNLQRVRELQGS